MHQSALCELGLREFWYKYSTSISFIWTWQTITCHLLYVRIFCMSDYYANNNTFKVFLEIVSEAPAETFFFETFRMLCWKFVHLCKSDFQWILMGNKKSLVWEDYTESCSIRFWKEKSRKINFTAEARKWILIKLYCTGLIMCMEIG